ncbi:hypothetical protein [Pyrobaculum aerophilum]|uniref:Uncharacterized protein n=1 Tax=Pyrobaculum aerophilum TaxID=13773 RepID=A0A832T232_9CREN|nr:hypothetical protein [Pyrobaculum aerophilum]HII47812.1 hypothetical protein [Pyrobaculum aerophilum]
MKWLIIAAVVIIAISAVIVGFISLTKPGESQTTYLPPTNVQTTTIQQSPSQPPTSVETITTTYTNTQTSTTPHTTAQTTTTQQTTTTTHVETTTQQPKEVGNIVEEILRNFEPYEAEYHINVGINQSTMHFITVIYGVGINKSYTIGRVEFGNLTLLSHQAYDGEKTFIYQCTSGFCTGRVVETRLSANITNLSPEEVYQQLNDAWRFEGTCSYGERSGYKFVLKNPEDYSQGSLKNAEICINNKGILIYTFAQVNPETVKDSPLPFTNIQMVLVGVVPFNESKIEEIKKLVLGGELVKPISYEADYTVKMNFGGELRHATLKLHIEADGQYWYIINGSDLNASVNYDGKQSIIKYCTQGACNEEKYEGPYGLIPLANILLPEYDPVLIASGQYSPGDTIGECQATGRTGQLYRKTLPALISGEIQICMSSGMMLYYDLKSQYMNVLLEVVNIR